MLSRTGALLAPLLLIAGCSLIVGGKLDEKSPSDGATRDTLRVDRSLTDGKPPGDASPQPKIVRGELGGTGKGPYLIGERLEIPVWQWPAADYVAIGGIPCVGAKAGALFVCTVAPLTPDGSVLYTVRNANHQSLHGLGEAIEIRRLLGAGVNGSKTVVLYDQATLKPMGAAITLPDPMSADAPRMSLSGRYLLVNTTGGLVLVDLVSKANAKLPPECKLIRGTSFEPEHVMRKVVGDLEPFMFFRPERGLLCSAGVAQPLRRLELPEPPARIDQAPLKSTPAPTVVQSVVEATTLVDLAGRKWLAGITDNGAKREVFSAEIGKPPSFAPLPSTLNPIEVVLAPLEVNPKPVFSQDVFLVVLAKETSGTSGTQAAILLHPDAGALKEVQQVPLSGLNVARLAWVTYTNLVALERTASSNTSVSYLRLGLSTNGKEELQLLAPAGVSVGSGLELQAFPVTPLDLVLFWTSYNRRFGQVAGNRILIYQDAPTKALQVDDTLPPLIFGNVKQVVAHPMAERLLVLTDKLLVGFKFGGFTKLLAKEQTVTISADGILLQP